MSKEFGGGELLRAVLEAEAVDSMPYFYMLPFTGQNGTAAQMLAQTAALQTENDSCFLMTSIFGLTSSAFLEQAEYVGIFDAGTASAYINGSSTYFSSLAPLIWTNQNSVYAGLLNDSLANCVTLPEYILWGPNSLIGATWLGHNFLGGGPFYKYLVLGGIKYHLKGN